MDNLTADFSVTVYKSGRGFNIPKKECRKLRVSGGDSVYLVIRRGMEEIYRARKTLKSGTEIYGSDLVEILHPNEVIHVTASIPIRDRQYINDAIFIAQESASGYQANSKIKKIVEICAMERAEEELKSRGYSDIKDTSAHESYDFSCKQNGTTYYVEVKGTQGKGESVIVTTGEVKHAQKTPERSIMIIVSGVQIGPNDEAILKDTSNVQFIHPWNPQTVDLTILQYRWDVPVMKEK